MPLWSQHLLVTVAALACAAFLLRQGFLSLRGRKSKLNGCGTCGSCGSTPRKGDEGAKKGVAIIPVDLLKRKRV